MLKALDEVLNQLKPQGMQFVRVDELMELDERNNKIPLAKRIFAKTFLLYDKTVHKVLRIKALDAEDPFLKIRIRAYQGSHELHLDDGETIRKGDQVVELHLNNEELYRLGSNARSMTQLSVQMIRSMQHLMPKLTNMMQTDPLFQKVKGIYGISIIHRGTQRFGFSVIDLPKGLFTTFTKLYLRFLLYAVHPHGKERLKTKTELLEPKVIAISREELTKRYRAL